MPSLDDTPSSPPTVSTSPELALAYYKGQYELLETELAEFQASSRELEAELEKDVDAAEKRERQLKEKLEGMGFEVEEWKTKYRQCKAEANSAQNILQKEITTLRENSRTLQLKLRDIEVTNDDIERQARNTSSSLEDLESKYNIAIERAVILESEIHIGDLERESLRIETQRLRDELSDLRIEAEINQEKLRHQEAGAERDYARKPHIVSTGINPPQSPISESSPVTTASSPIMTTPPATKSASTLSDAPTPPSPPISETSVTATTVSSSTPAQSLGKMRPPKLEPMTPRSTNYGPRPPRHSRGPSVPLNTPLASRASQLRAAGNSKQQSLTSSNSLHHIRGLIGQMQRLEQRVHSARSKLPAPANTPPQASPRYESALGGEKIASNITVRSSRKRTGGSSASHASSIQDGLESTPLSTHYVSRLSLGAPPPMMDKNYSRPSSRASNVSRNSASVRDRPSSRANPRTSLTGSRTPLGHYSQAGIVESRRPRSSIGGNYGHQHSASVSAIVEKDASFITPVSRRTTLTQHDLAPGGSGIPTPSGLPRRQSGGVAFVAGSIPITPTDRRTSSGLARKDEPGEMRPPSTYRKLSGVGES
ncbi:MAG: NADH:ubiquinone oxidoreductase [Trizodia sp. TS-e1964]|nr:MAG: NADH:ubiquinone oxidoreductase [Trizodia sp. TS-e1964]